MSEKQFIQCTKDISNGKKDALKEIYTTYIAFIYSIIYEIIQNRENAEDITSEFFIKLWDVADQYRTGNNHKAWLATIAKHMALDFIRKYKKEMLMDEIPDYIEQAERSNVEQKVIEDISLQNALDKLKENERQIINMKILGDMTFKDIAKVLQLPMGTVTWKYQNALHKLRRYGYE